MKLMKTQAIGGILLSSRIKFSVAPSKKTVSIPCEIMTALNLYKIKDSKVMDTRVSGSKAC